jgi:hypothetical protein
LKNWAEKFVVTSASGRTRNKTTLKNMPEKVLLSG